MGGDLYGYLPTQLRNLNEWTVEIETNNVYPIATDVQINNIELKIYYVTCTISSSSSGVFVLTPGESLVGTVSLSANTTSITVGESVVFTATVEDTDGEPLEDLTVSFYRDGVSLGSGVSDDTGMVQLTVSSWSSGSDCVP